MAQILSNDTAGRRTTIRRYTLCPEHSLPSLDRPFRSPPEIEFFVWCCTQYAMHYRQEIGNAFPAKKGTQFLLSNKKKPHLVSSKTPGKLESSRAVVRQNPGIWHVRFRNLHSKPSCRDVANHFSFPSPATVSALSSFVGVIKVHTPGLKVFALPHL